MSYNIGEKVVLTRKSHVCFGCGRNIPAKTKMQRDCVIDGGTAWTCYLCMTCLNISRSVYRGDEFCFGDLYEEAIEIEAILKNNIKEQEK